MSFIKTLMGRREFLAAGVASTCALTCKKVSGLDPVAAITAGQAAPAGGMNLAGHTCPHLLAPLAIRGKVLKNRIMYTVSGLFAMQGPENYPS
jgi:hypothetical protein